MMTNNIRRILVGLLVAGACVCVSETAAQSRHGLHVEPRTQTTQLLDDRAVLVGIRAGIARTAGLSFDAGLDLLTRRVSRNPGLYLGIGPEVGVGLSLSDRLGFRIRGG